MSFEIFNWTIKYFQLAENKIDGIEAVEESLRHRNPKFLVVLSLLLLTAYLFNRSATWKSKLFWQIFINSETTTGIIALNKSLKISKFI